MLKTLHLKNFALFADATFEPNGRFLALTGETGAGKSLLLESLRLLAGGRTNTQFIRHGENFCRITALFSDLSEKHRQKLICLGLLDEDEHELLITRTITDDGKTKITVGGRPATLSLLREAMGDFMEIQTRTDNSALQDESRHVDFLTRFADCEDLFADYRTAYEHYRKASADYRALKEAQKEVAEKRELFQLQLSELKNADLKENEEEALLAKKNTLKNAANIRSSLTLALRALGGGERSGAKDRVFEAAGALDKISDTLQDIPAISEKLTDIGYELESLFDDIKALTREIDEDAEDDLNRIEERLLTLAAIKRRYGGSIEAAIERKNELEEKLSLMDEGSTAVSTLASRRRLAYNEAVRLGTELSEKRKEAAKKLCDALHAELSQLDLENMRFAVRISPSEQLVPSSEERHRIPLLRPDGLDLVSFCITANIGESEKPLSETASTGEIARLTLALRSLLALTDESDVLVLDEIDSGVSGKTAKKIGETLKRLSQSVQIICITHSAQVASSADEHHFIQKSTTLGRTESRIYPLDFDGRVDELSRILGGMKKTDASVQNARELLADQ